MCKSYRPFISGFSCVSCKEIEEPWMYMYRDASLKKIKILLGLKYKLVKAEHCQFNHKNNINVAFAHVYSHDWQGDNKLGEICNSLRCPNHSLKIWDWKIMWMILDSEREKRSVHIRSKVPKSHNFLGSILHPSMTTSCQEISACLWEVSISTKCLLKGSTISTELYNRLMPPVHESHEIQRCVQCTWQKFF